MGGFYALSYKSTAPQPYPPHVPKLTLEKLEFIMKESIKLQEEQYLKDKLEKETISLLWKKHYGKYNLIEKSYFTRIEK